MAWIPIKKLLDIPKPHLRTTGLVRIGLLGWISGLSKNLQLHKHSQIKSTGIILGMGYIHHSHSHYCWVAQMAGVCMRAQGLRIPQGLVLGQFEQMVIITRAQKAAVKDGGGAVLNRWVARLISATWMG